MHWMNPPQLQRVVEIIKGEYTDAQTYQATVDLCKQYNKEIVVANKDVWFFLASRAHCGWLFEAMLMYLNKEAEPIEIDAVAKYKLGLPMGPFEQQDFTGNVDTRTKGLASTEKILKTHPEFEPWPAFLAVARKLTQQVWRPMSEKGLNGIKNGKGFYDYPGGIYVKPEIPEKLAEKIPAVRVLGPAINTAAWCVTNDVGDIAEVNKSLRLAYGWPKGPFEFINDLGIDSIRKTIQEKQKAAPDWLHDYYNLDPLIANWKEIN